MKSKKIFFIADTRSIHTVKWVDYFVDQGYEVYLATFASINNTKCKNIFFLSHKGTNVKGGNYHYLFSIGKLSKIFDDIQPDIINAHYSYSMGLVALLAKKKSKLKSELSVVCHGSDILSPPKPIIFNLVNQYILHQCDKIFVVSDQIKDKLDDFGIDLNKVFVGQYGINISSKEAIKDIDILSNRNYVPNSRIEFLLEGLKFFKDQGLNIIFVLPHVDQSKLENLRKNYPFVDFYTHMPYENMLDMVRRTKIYISATQSDGSSLSLLEAMYNGAVPVISNIVSNRSWILDGINGYLFDTKQQFQDKIKNTLNEDVTEIIKLNKILVSQKSNYDVQMKKIEGLLVR